MSMADSRSQSNIQPSLSQLWPGFGSNASDLPAFGRNTTNSNLLNTANYCNGGNIKSADNNYVNFNEFIRQHNIQSAGGGGGGGGSSSGSGGGSGIGFGGGGGDHPHQLSYSTPLNVDYNNPLIWNTNGKYLNNGTYQQQNMEYYPYYHEFSCQNGFTNNDFNKQPKNMPPDNNDLTYKFHFPQGQVDHAKSTANELSGFNALHNTNSTDYINNYDHLYSTFSSNGTTYYGNPFATGFDFTATKLQANAPEFIPRFDKLSLDDGDDANGGDDNVRHHINGAGSGGLIQYSESNNSNRIDGKQNSIPETVVQQNNIEFAKANQNKDHLVDMKTNTKSSSNRLEKNIERFSRNLLNRSNETSSNSTSSADSPTSAFDSKNLRITKTNNNIEETNGRQQQDHSEKEDRCERYLDRSERFHIAHRGNRERFTDHHQRYDNYRSSKRREDWNRNRNGFRAEEKGANDSLKDSPVTSPEKKNANNSSPKEDYPEMEKLSQRDKLIRDIEMRRLECLVCVEYIKSHQPVWSCHNCYHIFHLQCISKWALSSKSDDGWRCPACQNVEKDVPQIYYCFCGKIKQPPYNRMGLAHSCGEMCGRIEGCSHACTLLCHPGPCPPCHARVKRECGCGKTTQTMQCYMKEAIECDSVCGKLLNCEVHHCPNQCHEDKCLPCQHKIQQKCHCTKQERQVTCTKETHDKHAYSCGRPCGKMLTCGNHKCKDCCHTGDCKACKQSPDVVTSCPCGKMPIPAGQRTTCLDTIPVCGGICGKTLKCGKPGHPHHCARKCHLGNCPPCNKQTAVKCRCGHMDQMIKCRQLSTRADDARCKKRCTKKRSCGKHKCNQECCIDVDHICPLPCNYTLSCGKHKCDLPCHRGNCPPCYRSSFEELFCECGAEVIYPPVACGTKRPPCKKPCSRQHPCEHPPQHNCHSASTCPPCMIFTTKWCFGQHEQRKTIPCSQQSFSCGMACSKPLPCGRHKCIKPCHEKQCQATEGEICKQSCPLIRSTCDHMCLAPCHDGDCPDTPCKKMVEIQCECGHRKQMRPCHEIAREYSRIATAQLASSMAEMARGNYMELSEILAPMKLSNKSNKTLDCNDECRVAERNRLLSVAFGSRTNEAPPPKLMTKYSEFIRNFAKRDLSLVKSIHEALTTLVKLAKDSKQKSRSHSFPIMNREKRQLVHEMCEVFGVDSVAYDAEPNRNVVATAYKNKCWLPAASIMEVIQRESGQRRVPVPNNNAWSTKR